MKQPCVYILASRRNGTIYTGVTSDLVKRVYEHRTDIVAGFTRKYRVHTLVWFEQHGTMETAIGREKAIKEWKRAWKIELIEALNPYWLDCMDRLLVDAKTSRTIRFDHENKSSFRRKPGPKQQLRLTIRKD